MQLGFQTAYLLLVLLFNGNNAAFKIKRFEAFFGGG